MMEYILRVEDKPREICEHNYYQCIDAPWWAIGNDILCKLPKYTDECVKEQGDSYSQGYSSGMHGLWTAVQYLLKNNEIVDQDWSAEDLMKEYEKFTKKRPEPYEEWAYEDGTKCVVMDIMDDSRSVSVFTENGCVEACTTADLKEYTGRTFPQIDRCIKNGCRDYTIRKSERVREGSDRYNL